VVFQFDESLVSHVNVNVPSIAASVCVFVCVGRHQVLVSTSLTSQMDSNSSKGIISNVLLHSSYTTFSNKHAEFHKQLLMLYARRCRVCPVQ